MVDRELPGIALCQTLKMVGSAGKQQVESFG
jgi:hypothetical protein